MKVDTSEQKLFEVAIWNQLRKTTKNVIWLFRLIEEKIMESIKSSTQFIQNQTPRINMIKKRKNWIIFKNIFFLLFLFVNIIMFLYIQTLI